MMKIATTIALAVALSACGGYGQSGYGTNYGYGPSYGYSQSYNPGYVYNPGYSYNHGGYGYYRG